MEEKKPILNFRGSVPLKTISINQHLKQPAMNNQLTIEDRVMKRNLSPKYRFTQHNHFQIIDILEEYRIKFNIDKREFSNMAGLSVDHYSNVSSYNARFSIRSYASYRDAIIKLKNSNEPKPVYTPTPTPTQAPLTNNVELTAEMCINFLKATGIYKISKSEVTTNWIEL
jgi:hypothetical protein